MDRDHRAGDRQLTGTPRTATIIPPGTLGQQARIATFRKQRDSAGWRPWPGPAVSVVRARLGVALGQVFVGLSGEFE